MKRLLLLCITGLVVGSLAAFLVVWLTFNGVEETLTHFAVEGANAAQ